MPIAHWIVAAALVGAPAHALAQDTPLNVVATVGMIADIAHEVGGDCIAGTTLMGAGIDPHLYRATARDVRTFQAAELVLYAGYALEGQLADVLERLADRTPTVAVVEAAVPRDQMIATDDAYGVDPHAWMDAGLWARTVPVIADAIAGQRPDCADAIAAEAARYAQELAALDAWAQASIATVPEPQRILVTAHDAFAYYGAAYGLAVFGIQGISTEAEASIGDIRTTAQRLTDNSIPSIFVESTINPRTIQAVIDAAGQQGHDVAIGGSLYSDAMGEAGTAAGTYIGMIHANTVSIVSGLGGTPLPLPAALAAWADRFGVQAQEDSLMNATQ